MEFDPDNIPSPLELHREAVKPEWIDYNGHMNVAYYLLVFDHNADGLFEYIGLGEAFRAEHNVSSFALESHVTYQRELKPGAEIRVTTQLLDCDEKRIHYFAQMYDVTEGFLAATAEWMSIHVDMTRRKAAPFLPPVRERLEAIRTVHAAMPVPAQVGRVIGIRR